MSAVTLAQVKAQINALGTANDVELQVFIDRAEQWVARRVGPLAATEIVDEVCDGGRDCILLKHRWIVSLDGITYNGGTTLDLEDLHLDAETGLIKWNYGTTGYFPAGSRNVLVSYTAGFDPLPEDLVYGIALKVAQFWETQRPNSAVRPQQQADADAVPGVRWAAEAEEVLRPFYKHAGFA